MMRLLASAVLAFGLALAGGCLSGAGLKSFTADAFPPYAHQAMVKDVAERLYNAYPPGRTALFLAGTDDFGAALDENLRGKGYSIMPEPGGGAMTVAWTVDRLDEGAWYLIVRLSDGYSFARVYKDNGRTLTPGGGLSQGIF